VSAEGQLQVMRALAWAVVEGLRTSRDGLDVVLLGVAVARWLELDVPDNETLAKAFGRHRTRIAHRCAEAESKLLAQIAEQL